MPASCVLYVPEAQGSLPRGATHCTYAVRVPASCVPYVPRTVAPQALKRALDGLGLAFPASIVGMLSGFGVLCAIRAWLVLGLGQA